MAARYPPAPDAAAVDRERERLRQYLGYLYSTPQYWGTLDLLGESEVGRQLHQMSRAGQWAEMPGLITATLFDELVTSGVYTDIVPRLRQRYGGLVEAVTLRMPDDPLNSRNRRVSIVVRQLDGPEVPVGLAKTVAEATAEDAGTAVSPAGGH